MTPKRVVIVGGGTAGWVTASNMNGALNRDGQKVVDITLIESPDIPRIAVGEATFPTIHQILFNLSLDETEFMKATDATYKHSIKFANWLYNEGEHYHHQFSRYNPEAVDHYGADWLKSDRTILFADTVSAQPAICDQHLSPKLIGTRQFQNPLTYAFHLNALKFADYLRDVATANGVTHHLENMTEVEMTDDGNIAAVNTDRGNRYEADLFIDCTGFSALLIEKKLGIEWDDFSQWLLCDRALVMQVPYETYYPGFVRSGTIATALNAGWIWDIPLINRRGVGYVYSSQFISDDEAELELRRYEGAHSDDLPTRIVPFKAGCRKQTWAKNCVAIGLSGGFLEPLESTGIYLVQLAAMTLAEFFPHHGHMEELADKFNGLMSDRFEEILGFLNMHYCLTRRTDTEFWLEIARPERILPALQERLDLWRIKPVSKGDFKDLCSAFSYQNHELVLFGMDFARDYYAEIYGDDLSAAEIPEVIVKRLEGMQRQLPPHELWLQQTLGMPEYKKPKQRGSVWD
ncbi:MAG: tryptophan 7-halogenase [Proteobacteria bacterium]|nr:tryptophan 7-halogenase [Pseudomonadota bacterium]